MIPILYEKTETAFTTNGLGRLGDCISCLVTEQRNSLYELEIEYPVSGINYSNIQVGRIIAVTHNENGDIQPFDIYKVSEPINGIVTINACHISYRLNEIVVKPFSATTCANAIAGISTNSMNTNPFSFTTDKTLSIDFDVAVPTNARALLGGEQNSILDVYGPGEYEFDVFDVKFLTARGGDTEVSIRYGKNLVDFLNETDTSNSYNAVAPYWRGTVSDPDTGEEVDTLVTLTEGYVSSGYSVDSGRTVVVPLDLSGEFETAPTQNELRTLATSKLAASYAWRASQNITVDFVQLWQTEEYANFAPLQKVKLCDTVLVDVPMYGISNLRIKVVSVTWDALLERYSEMQLGDPRKSYADTLAKPIDAQIKEVQQTANIANDTAMAAVTKDTIHYLATNLSSGVTTSTAGWTTTVQSMSAVNKYLWTYHTYGKANGDTVDTSPVITGVYGDTGTAGASVTGITELYALNDDPDNPPADNAFSANVQTPSASQRYLWNMEQISFSNGTTSNMGKHILLTYTAGIQGRGISSVTEYYAINNSTTAPATSAFSTTVQTPTSSNPYVWNYEVINYTDGLNPTTTDKRIIGVLGQNGTTVSSVQYGTSNSASTAPSSWSNSAPSSIAQGKWLWVKTTYSNSSESITKSYIGTDGDDGSSVWIKSTQKVGDTTTVTLTNGTTDTVLTIVDGTDGTNGINGMNGYVHVAWATSADGSQGFSTTVSTGKTYLGVYTDNTAADSQSYTSYSWSLIKGANGTNGTNGVSVTKVEPQYYMSTSSSSLTGGSWSYQLNYISGRYIWTRDEVTYSNSTQSHSTAIYNSALTTAWINADSANQIATSIQQHFWFTNTAGGDNGAHIAETDKATFENDPVNGGANLLATSGGVAVRDGLTELSSFSATGVSLGKNSATATIGLAANNGTIKGRVYTTRASNDSYALEIKNAKTMISGGTKDVEIKNDTGNSITLTSGTQNSEAWQSIGLSAGGQSLSLQNAVAGAVGGGLILATEHSADDEAWLTVSAQDSNEYVSFGIGTDGTIRGIYDGTTNDWMIGIGGSTDTVLAPLIYEITTSQGSNVRVVNSTYGYLGRYVSSSRRYKDDIENISDEALDPNKLYDVRVVQFKYKDDYLSDSDPRHGKLVNGFIAEELEEVYPIAVNYEDGLAEDWEPKFMIPPMLKLIQDQKKKIDELEQRIEALERSV